MTTSDWRTLKLKNETRETQEAVVGLAGLTGCLMACLGWTLIVFGSLCSLTVIGAIIGVPMIILGAAILGSSPFTLFFGLVGNSAVKADAKSKEAKLKEEMLVEAGGVVSINGPCPWCGTTVSSYSNVNTIKCPACSERISIHNRMYLRGS